MVDLTMVILQFNAYRDQLLFFTSKTKYNKIKRTVKYKNKQIEDERLTNLAKVKPREFWKVITNITKRNHLCQTH